MYGRKQGKKSDCAETFSAWKGQFKNGEYELGNVEYGILSSSVLFCVIYCRLQSVAQRLTVSEGIKWFFDMLDFKIYTTRMENTDEIKIVLQILYQAYSKLMVALTVSVIFIWIRFG